MHNNYSEAAREAFVVKLEAGRRALGAATVMQLSVNLTRFQNLFTIVFKGLSQIMLQSNIWTGVLFALGIFVNSITMGLAAIFGSVCGATVAAGLKCPRADIEDGLYGFNPALVAIAMFYFFPPTITTVFGTIVGVVVATVVMRFMHERRLPPFTFPFVLTAWILLTLFSPVPMVSPSSAASSPLVDGNLWAAVPKSFGQVMLQENTLTGAIFLIGLLVNSSRTAISAVFGSVVAIAFALGMGWSKELIFHGIFGFNAVLCAIALSNFKNLLIPLSGVLVSAALMKLMLALGLPALTSPFVFAAWIVLGTRQLLIGKPVESPQ